MATNEGCRLMHLGSELVRIILHGDGKFYRKDDENKENPLKVLPLSNGFIIIHLWQYHDDQYGPTKQDEMNYEIERELESLVGSKNIEDEQFGVRIGMSQSDNHPVDFYRILNC